MATHKLSSVPLGALISIILAFAIGSAPIVALVTHSNTLSAGVAK